MGGRFKREETFVYLWVIHGDVWQKPTQYCKTIMLQLKIKKLEKKHLIGYCKYHSVTCSYQLALAKDTCRLPLPGLNHEPLQLLTFRPPWREFRVQSRNEAVSALEKLSEEVFR